MPSTTSVANFQPIRKVRDESTSDILRKIKPNKGGNNSRTDFERVTPFLYLLTNYKRSALVFRYDDVSDHCTSDGL